MCCRGTARRSRLLDVSDDGFLVNTGKQLILVDAGAGTWGVEEHSGVCWGASAAQLHAGRSRPRFGHTPPFDHVGGLTTQDGKRVFQSRGLRREAEKRFLVVAEIPAKAPKERNRSSGVRKPSQRRTSKAVVATRLLAPSNRRRHATRPAARSSPGHTGYDFRQRDKKSCFGAHHPCTARQLQHPEVTAISTSTRSGCGEAIFNYCQARARACFESRDRICRFLPWVSCARREWVQLGAGGYLPDQWVDK